MKFFEKYMVYIYVGMWMVYYLQNMLMLKGLAAQIVLAILMLIGFLAFVEVNVFYKTNQYLKWLNVILLVLTIYGIIPIIGGWTLIGNWQREMTRSHIYLQNVYRSVLPIYAFYLFTLKRQITEKSLSYLFYGLFSYSILAYYQRYLISSESLGQDEITNNMGYYFVPLIPMIHLLKIQDIMKYVFLVITIVFIFLSMKRGAILVGAFMMMIFLYYQLKGLPIKKVLYSFFLSLVVFAAIMQFTANLYESSPYFKKRVEQTVKGNSNHRDEIYTSYFEYFINKTTTIEFFIGNGANATIVLLGEYAHNDWLEFAICQGVLGIVMYLVYWALFFMEWKKYRGPTNGCQTLGMIIVAYFMIALYSMSIDNMPIAATLCIGYCFAVDIRIKQIDVFKEVLTIKNTL